MVSPEPPAAANLTPIAIRNRLFDLSLDGWATWANVVAGDSARQMPRFEAYASPVEPTRVMAGHTALRIAAEPGQSFEAGVRQTVTGLVAGTPLRFNAFGQIWASNGEDRAKSDRTGQANLRIGLDPQGGNDANAPAVVWSSPADPWDEYQPFQVEAVAGGEIVTLFLSSQPTPSLKHLEVFWDNTRLYSTGPAGPVPAPAAAPAETPAAETTAPEAEPQAETPAAPESAEGKPGGKNKLHNGNFDDGFYRAAPELAVPEGWELWYAREADTPIERQDTPFAKPETAVWREREASKDEKKRYFLDGPCCWRVRAEWKPVWVRLQQRVSGLNPGERYRLTVPVLPEPWAVFDKGKKRFATEPAAAEQRLWADTGGATAGTEWLTGDHVPFGDYTPLELDFTAEGDEATVALELRGRWGLARTQWIVDKAELHRLK